MTWYTSRALIVLRTIARKLGLTRHLVGLRGSEKYEQAFDEALFSTLQHDDIVWDVGANVGYYTKRFAEAVGPDGHVVAFEPFPATAERLQAHMEDIRNYSLRILALGSHDGKVKMEAGKDELGATTRIIPDAAEGVAVCLSTGDGLIAQKDVPSPTVIKIDTEGFELDVLQGMSRLLKRSSVRAVFVEVHFGLLAERGQPKAPREIEGLLDAAGFSIRWIDPSHIAALRI